MRKLSSIFVATALLASGTLANASENGGYAVGVKAGTLGLGVEVNYPISSMLTISAGINKFSRSMTDTTDDIDYDADLNLQTIALLANFHPFAGSFRLTGGFMINSNELKMTARPNGATTYQIGDVAYDINDVDSLKAKVDFNNFVPYAGIGVGHSSSSGFGFNLDVGVLMQGKPNVSFTATGNALAIPGFQAELDKEEANAEDDIKEFTMYPVVSFGINYRF